MLLRLAREVDWAASDGEAGISDQHDVDARARDGPTEFDCGVIKEVCSSRLEDQRASTRDRQVSYRMPWSGCLALPCRTDRCRCCVLLPFPPHGFPEPDTDVAVNSESRFPERICRWQHIVVVRHARIAGSRHFEQPVEAYTAQPVPLKVGALDILTVLSDWKPQPLPRYGLTAREYKCARRANLIPNNAQSP